MVLPSVGLDCTSVKQAVQRVEDAAAARSKDAARVSLLHMAVRSRSLALVRPARMARTGRTMAALLCWWAPLAWRMQGFQGAGGCVENLPCSVSSGLLKLAALACWKHVPVCARPHP